MPSRIRAEGDVVTVKTLCEGSLHLSVKMAEKVLRHYAWVESIIEPDPDDPDM